MKKNIKTYIRSSWAPAALLLAFACVEPVDLITDGAQEGGLLRTTTSALNYVVGNQGPYKMEFIVPKTASGVAGVSSIQLYKHFETDPKYKVMEGGVEVEKQKHFVSNEVLAKTITISSSETHAVSETFTFTELVAGLQIEKLDGTTGPLPVTDGELLIGDRWVFRVVTILDDGRTVEQGYTISAGVSTRYAGKYKAVLGEYYRIGVLTAATNDWPAETVIESVDATTYRVLDYFGIFTGNEYYFQIIDGVITYPDETPAGDPQTGNGQPFITCQSNPSDMTLVHCDESNIVINNDVSGKDRLIMSYGYFTAGSGPRAFYQVLEKIVE